MNRYKQLKKENDQLLNTLGDSYQRVATIYIKKARGFAVKNEDTEVKVRDTLYLLKNTVTKEQFAVLLLRMNQSLLKKELNYFQNNIKIQI